ncbi:hypothetical protein GCM10009740_38640 [Terrabacter terrae]|uniref:Uncharacterized protein n=2 Tax=Terrabacter terrae TaxID=318434 RepID=A0ABN1ZQZ0_9MICO
MWRDRVLRVLLTSVVAVGLMAEAATAATRPEPVALSAAVNIVTVPAVPGAAFVFDGRLVTTDKQGIAHIIVPAGTHGHTLTVKTTHTQRAGGDYSFARWWRTGNHTQDYERTLTGLRVRKNLTIKAAYRASFTVRYGFADPAKRPVPRSRVATVEFRGDNGQTVTATGGGTVRLLGIRPVNSSGTLVAKEIKYTVQRVQVDGSNVVRVNQQPFVPSQRQTVTISLLLLGAHFRTRDFLFGSPVGTTVVLTYPDRSTKRFPLDALGEADVAGLARGNYTVSVEAPGIAFTRPVALSRNQYVDLPVVTYRDLGVVGGMAVLVLGSLMALKRVRVRSRRRAVTATS